MLSISDGTAAQLKRPLTEDLTHFAACDAQPGG
jgi:hypothetical protein